MDTLALSEQLKLLFNLTQFYPYRKLEFSRLLPHVLKMLNEINVPSPPLQPPVTHIINSLLNLDLEDVEADCLTQNLLFPESNPRGNVDRVIGLLESAVREYSEEQLEELSPPILALARKIFELAPEDVKTHMRYALLPSNEDRTRPLGKSDSLSAFLLRLSTSPVAPSIRESIQNLLFELSNKDPATFVQNVGYGFASGFLMSHDMPIPENAMEAWSTSDISPSGISTPSGEKVLGDETDTRPFKMVRHALNPITGQRIDKEEEVDTGPPMSEDEKEREAAKLFVLFER